MENQYTLCPPKVSNYQHQTKSEIKIHHGLLHTYQMRVKRVFNKKKFNCAFPEQQN